MSVILITNHDETIYNITKTQADIKKKIYKSKFKKETKFHRKKVECVKLHATMGLAEEVPPDPKNYLRKHLGKPAYTSCPPTKEPRLCQHPRPKVPTLEELKKEEKPQKHEKNFIADNIKNASKMKVKDPVPKTVTDKNGTKEVLHGSWMDPVFIKLPKFGKTPKYLERFISDREKEYQKKKDASSVLNQPLCRYITRDEREQLLKGLKQNWEELQKQYQVLPILTDTIPKKLHKTKMENDLKQLEQDIVLIERHPYIYLYDDKNTSQPQD